MKTLVKIRGHLPWFSYDLNPVLFRHNPLLNSSLSKNVAYYKEES